MNRFRFTYVAILFFLSSVGYAQISPGPLSTAHADLEGMRNCTLCHDLGKKVSNAKCLDCHNEIQVFLDENQGYHAHSSVKNKDCFECHSEHHGRKFDQTRFNQDNFDHLLTGYELEGQHDLIDCRECHKAAFIADKEIRQRDKTFLGLDQECLSCHDDYHQQTLSNDCVSCHNFEDFSPAPKFDHEDTDYSLVGAHKTVECAECHRVTTRQGKEFQEFSGIPFNDCISCHDDPHQDQISGTCAQCHTERSFASFVGQRRFNHNQTDFKLKGKHRQTGCFECHDKTSNPITVFQDQKNISENNCIACHEDEHEGKYGDDCAKCHNETSFLSLNDMSFFDHSVTDYPLEGRHQEVDCRECHKERFSTPIDFSACQNCHEDYHQGEFIENGKSPDCVECHSLEHGFDYSLYGFEQHQESSFPLEGAHIATPCFACHLNEEDERWAFRNIGETCVDCHDDIHEGYIDAKFYPQQDCQACHISDEWVSVDFDHSQTNWPLEGKHSEVACRACHFQANENTDSYLQVFANLGSDCVSCHENVHGDEFAVNGVTDCESCHVTTSWVPERFDHDRTQFPLEGKHAEVDCRACHEITQSDGSKNIVYKIEKFECIDCHQ